MSDAEVALAYLRGLSADEARDAVLGYFRQLEPDDAEAEADELILCLESEIEGVNLSGLN